MNLWIGAEIESDVADEFRLARKEVENELAAYLKPLKYHLNLDSFDCIAIIRNDAVFDEIHRYYTKKRDMDFRLIIDYQQFKLATHKQRKLLILHMLMRAADILSLKQNISVAAALNLKEDIRRFTEKAILSKT